MRYENVCFFKNLIREWGEKGKEMDNLNRQTQIYNFEKFIASTTAHDYF